MTANPIGTIYDNPNKVIFVHDGMRGKPGPPGDDGAPGAPGSGINLVGPFAPGNSYSPNDGVTSRSSAVAGALSLWLQRSNVATSPANTEPHLDPSRWLEVGPDALSSTLGALFTVVQSNHPFTKVGQPAALTGAGYALGSSALYPVGLVREVIDASTFTLQTTGRLTEVDPSVVIGGLAAGTIYYVAGTLGTMTATAPTGLGTKVSPVFLADGPTSGVVLPWISVPVSSQLVSGPIQREKFYFIASDSQQLFTGLDENSNVLDLTDAQVEVFQNGLNLRETAQYIQDDISVTLAVPAALSDVIEIWADTIPIASVTAGNKLDGLVFDGVTTGFALKVGMAPVAFATSATFTIYLDGNPQEPGVDFEVTNSGGNAQIEFTFAPSGETGFWGTYQS